MFSLCSVCEWCQSPEIFAQKVFDGFAIDVWAAATILYVLLTSFPAFTEPHRTDDLFRIICVEGQLAELLCSWNIPLSDEACNLLQNMLWEHPRKRLTLAQVMEHPWVTHPDVQPPVG